MFVRCLWKLAGWATGEDGVDCEVKRWESWPWEVQSEREIGLPSLKGHGKFSSWNVYAQLEARRLPVSSAELDANAIAFTP